MGRKAIVNGDSVGICPRCGSWVDEGEPYCPECCYDGSGRESEVNSFSAGSDAVEINGLEYDLDDVEDALDELGYDFDDLEQGIVDVDELERILEEM